MFINCSSAYTAVPAPESLHSRGSNGTGAPTPAAPQSAAAFAPPRGDGKGIDTDPVSDGPFASVGTDSRGVPSRTDHLSALACETESCMSSLYGCSGQGRSVLGRLMSGCSNERSSSGLRPVQQQFLQQAFEAVLMATAAPPEGRALVRHQHPGRVSSLTGNGCGGGAPEIQNADRGHVSDATANAETNKVPGRPWHKQGVEVVDRQRVILEIFGRRSQNKQAMLQV